MASGLHVHPFSNTSSLIEGYVLNVDPIRSVCSIKTTMGQVLNNVVWLSHYFLPKIDSKVLVSTGLGYPVILGNMPKLGEQKYNISISGGEVPLDAGNSSMTRAVSILNPELPKDKVLGDNILATEGNSIITLLRSGSILHRAGHLSQIFLSKLHHLVRIVGSNYQRFSDSSSRVASNTAGRLYEWFGVDRDLLRNRTNLERYNEVYGDVATGEIARGEPNSISPEDYPEVDTRVRKYWLKNESGLSVMTETLFEDGKLDIVVTSSTGVISEVIIDPAYIKIDFDTSDTSMLIDTDGTKIDSKGHYIYIDSSGVHMG